MGFFSKLFDREKKKTIGKLDVIAEKVEALEEKYQAMSDEELSGQTAILKSRYKQEGKKDNLDELLPDAFAVVREASKRVLNMRHFHVQIIGGIVLHQGRIAEMKTGEGKTLVATLPAYLNALSGKGVHIVTVNDYLAKRDAEWMGKVFKFLGMTVGVILHDMSPKDKKAAYDSDITYATNNEIGFDYLRDNMATRLENVMQRGHAYAIIDEVDSILIDEARTPLIISAPTTESPEIYVTVQRFIRILKDTDYIMDEKDKHIYLSEIGVEKAERYFKLDNLGDSENADLMTKINSALRANKLMSLDKDYIVENDEVVIVDEFTGRKMEGRRFSEGLHQAIEAKESVRIKKENRTVATITFQNLFRLYKKLSGMTGTAKTEEDEFRGIYELDVVEIPTNRDMIRIDEADKIYPTLERKYAAIIEEIEKSHEKGQPLLVGTIDVAVSELLSKKLLHNGIPHNVLNAKSHSREAEIIAQAGRVGAVTIATNMAGRGTDILLGGNPEFMAKEQMRKEGYTEELISIASAYNALKEEDEKKARERFIELSGKFSEETEEEKRKVKELGGLRVLGTERHESRRIDNQLRGRSGRQGDEGSSCFYLSFEDNLLRLFGGDKLKSFMSSISGDTVIQMPFISKQIETAQRRCEENNFQRRRYVLNYDDVMNQQRNDIYTQRNMILNGADVHEQVKKYIEPLAEEITNQFIDFSQMDETGVNYEDYNRVLEQRLLKQGTGLITEELCGHLNRNRIINAILDETNKQYAEKRDYAAENGIDFGGIERDILLTQIDRHWMTHIDNMDILKKGIGLRGYGQKDPVMEYKREGFAMFDKMIDSIQTGVAIRLCKLNIEPLVQTIQHHVMEAERKKNNLAAKATTSIGRNDPCPCGSGKKYKNCCGN